MSLDELRTVKLEFADPKIFLHGVVGGFRLADRHAVVGSRFTSQILFFDSLGRGVKAYGREGAGPGEFGRLSSVVYIGGDTIAAFDGQSRRVSVMTSVNLIRSYQIEEPARSSPVGLAGAVGRLREDRLLIWTQLMPGRDRTVVPDQAGQTPVILFSVGPSGEAPAVVGEYPGEEVYIARSPKFGGALANLGAAPFGRWTRFGIYRDRIYVFQNDKSGFTVSDSLGRVLSEYRADWPIRSVSAKDRNLTIEEWVRRSTRTEEWNERRARFEHMNFPASMPAYRDAIVASDGIVWLERSLDWSWNHRALVGYDSTGLAVGKLALKSTDRILHIGSGDLLVLGLEEDGTESVRATHYRPSPSPDPAHSARR